MLKKVFKWQNLTHYLLLAIFVAILTRAMGWPVFLNTYYMPRLTMLWLYLVLFVGDTLVHFTFSILPKPYRWKD